MEFSREILELGKQRSALYQAREKAAARRTARVRPPEAEDWSAQIDATWGSGLPTERKLEIFDTVWTTIDERYASFHNIDVDWTALRRRYRPEVAAGVSRGRFAAIIGYMTLELRDSHVAPQDRATIWPLFPGFPILGVGPWFANNSGTCGTVQPDGSTLIYTAVPDHPLGLEPGDRVLGFDGRPWKKNLRDLLRAQLPLSPIWWGSSPTSFDDTFLGVANINWHLFKTIDVRKYRGGRVRHLSTEPLQAERFSDLCMDSMDIPGIPKPDIFAGDEVSWGVLPGTQIGYIYTWGWSEQTGADFTAAVKALTQDRDTDGLIVDHRFDAGGYLQADDDGLDMLFKGQPEVFGLDIRANPFHHFKMDLDTPPDLLRIGARDGVEDVRFYDRPIAILEGAGTVSMGDHSVVRLGEHPRARTFGRPQASAFGPVEEVDLDPVWSFRFPVADAWRVGNRHHYVTHDELPPDEWVWLRPKDVANGRDTVVEAAARWINRENKR